MKLSIFCADVGSIAKGNFGWACLEDEAEASGTDIVTMAEAIAIALNAGRRVALGFECPLFVPITKDPRGLTLARPGEGDRAWSAGAGAGSLATGLTETVWLLDRVRRSVTLPVRAATSWHEFCQDPNAALFVWEAFVTKDAKATTHVGDAELATRAFAQALPDPTQLNAVACTSPVRSLIGAALLQAGFATDTDWLRRPSLVLRVSSRAKVNP